MRGPVGLMVALSLVLTACSGAAAPTASPAGTVPAATPTIATTPTTAALKPLRMASAGGANFTNLPQLYAVDKGLFEKYGHKPELVELRADTTAVQGLLSGDYDVMFSGAGTGLVAAAAGADIKLVSSISPHVEYFFVTKSSIADLKGLEGKAIGISAPGAISEQAPKLVLKKHGVDVSKVNWTAVGNDGDRAKALKAGTIDGAVLNTVNTLAATANDPSLHILSNVGEDLVDDFLLTGIFITGATATQKPEVVQAFVTGLIEASRILQTDRAEATMYAKARGLPVDSVDAAYDKLLDTPVPFFGVDGGLDKKAFDSTVATLKDSGQLQGDITWEEMVDLRFVDAAIAKLGPFKKP